MLRRLHIQRDDIGGLGLEIRIVRAHVALETVRLEPGSLPHARNHHVAGSQMLGELARAPVRGAVRWRLACPVENSSFELCGALVRLAAAVAGVEPRNAVLDESLLPATYIGRRTIQSRLDGRVAVAFGQHEYQPGTSYVLGTQASRPTSRLQFTTFVWSQLDRCGHGAS